MSNLDEPKEFFATHKIGTSRDYGVIKNNDPHDHVVTVHGFMDDQASCVQIANSLNTDACKETDGQGCLNLYSCIALN